MGGDVLHRYLFEFSQAVWGVGGLTRSPCSPSS